MVYMSPELSVIKRTPQEPESSLGLGLCLANDLRLGSMALSTLIEAGHRVGHGFEAHDHTISHETHCGSEDSDCNLGTSVITRLDKDSQEEIIITTKPLQHGSNIEFCNNPDK